MNIEEIRKWHSLFYPDNALFEIRLLGGGRDKKKVWSGYFDNVEVMIKAIAPFIDSSDPWIGKPQAYFMLNEIDRNLYSRTQHDCFIPNPVTTKDNDIIRRRWVMIDFDAKRKADMSSSDTELEKAHRTCAHVYTFLKGFDFKEPVIAISGNGYHLQYRVDMPIDDDHQNLIKSFLEGLALKYTDDGVDIDQKVFNPARICKLYGTEARKGANTPERPWRLAHIVCPKDVQPIETNDEALFKKAIEALPKPVKNDQPISQGPTGYHGIFNLESWLMQHGLEYRIKFEGGIKKYQLRQCPWEEMHSQHHEYDSAICVMPDGKITFTCFHDHCHDKTWADVRKHYEPDYVPYSERQQRMQYPTQSHQQKQPEIKQQNDKMGPMWYEFDEIPDIDLDSLEKIPTGIKDLDKKIKGLYLSEVSIISGTNSSGKSSFLNTLLLNAVDAGYKCALWSGELRADILKSWIYMVAAGAQHLTPSTYSDGAWYADKATKEKIGHWLHGKFVLYNNSYGSKWEQIFMEMQQKQQEGFKLFVLDNLMMLDVDILGDSQNQQQKALVEKLGDFAKDKQVHIILVAHPRKSYGRGMSAFLRKDDIAGSGHIADLADNVFIIHRNNADFRRGLADFYGKDKAAEYDIDVSDTKGNPLTRGTKEGVGNVIEVCKNRLYGAVDELIDLYYEPESRRFKNYASEAKEYGWNTNASPANNIESKQEINNANDADPLGGEPISEDAPF